MYYKIPCSNSKCIINNNPIYPPNRTRNQFKEIQKGEGVSKTSEQKDRKEKPKLHNIVEMLKKMETRK